jgi:TRAP-type C4-dicarboxylate transport system permease small subunit
MTTAYQRHLARLHRIEDWVLTVLVVSMVLLAGTQILLRNVFNSGFVWAEPVLAILFFWGAMLGAIVATREDQHIGLDFIAHFVSGVKLRIARFLVLAFAAALCALMAWYSYLMVSENVGSSAGEVAGIPAWVQQLIMPLGFGVMALRFLIRAVSPSRPSQAEAASEDGA